MPEPHILLTVVHGTDCGNARTERGLTRRRLALAGRQHAAHHHLAHVLGLEAGALHGRLDGGTTELRRRERRERALEAAHGRARHAGDDDGVFRCACHDCRLVFLPMFGS